MIVTLTVTKNKYVCHTPLAWGDQEMISLHLLPEIIITNIIDQTPKNEGPPSALSECPPSLHFKKALTSGLMKGNPNQASLHLLD